MHLLIQADAGDYSTANLEDERAPSHGDAVKHFPWAWKSSELLAVRRPVEIDVNHTRGASGCGSGTTSAFGFATDTTAPRLSPA